MRFRMFNSSAAKWPAAAPAPAVACALQDTRDLSIHELPGLTPQQQVLLLQAACAPLTPTRSDLSWALGLMPRGTGWNSVMRLRSVLICSIRGRVAGLSICLRHRGQHHQHLPAEKLPNTLHHTLYPLIWDTRTKQGLTWLTDKGNPMRFMAPES